MHRLLERQLRKAQGPDGAFSLDRLLALVEQSYIEQERNRIRADRANEIMAAELTEMLLLREGRDRLEHEKAVAEAASIAKSQFIANMSHELRTPLNAVIGYSELMREDALEAKRATDVEDHERVLYAARRLLHLIDEILSLSKIESGKLSVEIEEFDLAEVLNHAIDAIVPAASENGSVIELEMSGRLNGLYGDPHRLGQCLLNLLSNAAKFTRGGLIRVRAWRSEVPDRIYVEVSDTGIGMSPDQVARVFSAFEQADASITREYGGTGLGLTITQRLAELMGGEISVKSELGAGSRFTLCVAADLDASGGHRLAL